MELGSEFHVDFENLTEEKDNVFNYLKEYSTVYVTNGRTAIHLLKPVLKGKVILLPEYICESVVEAFKDRFQIRYYKVDERLNASIESLILEIDENIDVVYIMNYFGLLQPQEVLKYLQEQKSIYNFVIIEDTTHSIFTKPSTIGDYCICSIRKWFSIPDGGILYSKYSMDSINIETLKKQNSVSKLEAMVLKKYYLKYQIDVNKIYREIFAREEKKLDEDDCNKELKLISDISKSLLQCYSIADMKKKRTDNFSELKKYESSVYENVLASNENFIPFSYPIYIEERDILRQYLMEHQIYCAVHWPYINFFKGKTSEYISKKILSLPIDQRYNLEHIEYMVNVLKKYEEESCNGMYSS